MTFLRELKAASLPPGRGIQACCKKEKREKGRGQVHS